MNIKKIRLIPVMMIISQLMLAGFVANWLINQYRDERDLLNDDLSRIYDESFNQVIDSLLFNRVVEPALNDSVTITMGYNMKADTSGQMLMKHFDSGAYFAKNDSCQNTIVAISLPDSLRGRNITASTAISPLNKKQDYLIRSVKLFINHSGDSAGLKRPLPGFLPGNLDTALFKKVFTEKTEKKKYGIAVTWISDSVQVVKKNKHITIGIPGGMHISNGFPGNLPDIQINRTFPYLIKRIGTQILFALILLLLTGSAFFFTNRSLKRQLMLNELRNDFVSNITHELRTPVSTVKVALEALKTFDKVNNPEITREYLDMAGQEMDRLDQLISKVLDQAMISEQKEVVQPQLSDLEELSNHVLLSLKPRFQARGASVKIDAVRPLESVMVDPLHFQGVLINLIDNSLKYCTQIPEINIRLWQEGGAAWLQVSDNGPGIPNEYLNRVFDKFFRVPTGDTHNIKGHGLGLSFAALVMKQHHGSISVKNLDEGGCAFTLRFPLVTS